MIKEKLNSLKSDESKKINKMAIPLVLNSVTGLIIGLCDQAMIGRISLEAFGAVGLIASTINSITGVVGMTAIAFNILGAKCKGADDSNGLNEKFAVNLLISIGLGVVFFILNLVLGEVLLNKVYNLSGKALQEGSEYINIFSLSLGLNMILFTFSSYLKIVNDTKCILYANVTSAVLNVVFDYILIFGHLGFPKMGMKGNAIGSVVALCFGVLIYFIKIKPIRLFSGLEINFNIVFKEQFKVALPLIGQEVLESTFIVIIINSILSHIGILEVSIYNMVSFIVSIALMPMYSYSQASLTFVSESTGSKDEKQLQKTPKICLKFALILYFSIAAVIIVLNNYVFRIITNDPFLIKGSGAYISLVLIYNIINIPNNIYKYSLQGIGYERWVFLKSVIINFFAIGIMIIFVVFLKWNLHGVYLSLFLNYIVLTVVFVIRYNKTCKLI